MTQPSVPALSAIAARAGGDTSYEITVTSFHPGREGGILIGTSGSERQLRRVVLKHASLARNPLPGEAWRVTGTLRAHPDYGLQLHAHIALPLLPQGRAIIRYLATNPSFPGIGWGLAQRLWDVLGEDLYRAIQQRDAAALTDVVGARLGSLVIDQFGLMADEVEVFRVLDRYGVNARTAGAAASLWGAAAVEKFKEDPYSLALLESWREVDQRALRMGLALDDERRLLAAVDEAFAVRYRQGHTAARRTDILALLGSLLPGSSELRHPAAVGTAIAAGRVVETRPGLLQSCAVGFMEAEVERLVLSRLDRQTIAPPASETEAAIAEIEAAEGYALTKAQREAVFMAVSCPVSAITGGAGTGKTTVVKAILAASERRRSALQPEERRGFDFPQVALAGRAAKRIAEATGREASTIARFMHGVRSGRRKLTRGLMVFDESSMLDLPSLYQLLTMLPIEMDLLLIGDPAQLPPIGPGLVFDRMAASDDVPRVRLDVIHRQSSATGIPRVAQAMREGVLVELPRFDPANPLASGVFMAEARSPEDIASTTLTTFRAMADLDGAHATVKAVHDADVQILCATKSGPCGAKALNDLIEREVNGAQPRIHDWGLSIGSKIIWLRNDYTKAPMRDATGAIIKDDTTGDPMCSGFMNGALGVLRRTTSEGAWVEFDDDAADEILARDLEKLSLGWAISVHKAQGSAFRRVIVPVTRSRLLDRPLMYTAITRAVETVVLVGDLELMQRAVAKAPPAETRCVAMRLVSELAL